MKDLLVDVGVLVLLLSLLVSWLAVWRIGHVVSWQALVRTAWATRSFAESVAFIRYCAEAREHASESWMHGRREI